MVERARPRRRAGTRQAPRRGSASARPPARGTSVSGTTTAGRVRRPRDDRSCGAPSSASSATGTGRRARLAHQPGQRPPAGPGDRDLVRSSDRAQRARAAVRPRRGRPRPGPGSTSCEAAIAARERAAVRVRVDRPPQRERRGVDDLRVRRLMPRRAGEVERRLLRRDGGGAPRRGARAARARPRPGRARRTGGSSSGTAASARRERRRGTLEHQEPAREQHERDHRGRAEDPRQHAVALLVAGGAAQQPPHAVQPRGTARA